MRLRLYMWLTLLFVMLGVQAVFAQLPHIDLASQKTAQQVLGNSFEASRYMFSFERLYVNEVKTEKGVFSELSLPAAHYVGELGNPKLPASHKLIEIPYGAEVKVVVHQYNVQEFTLSEVDVNHPLMPIQPSHLKKQDPALVPFLYEAEPYSKAGYIEPELVTVEILGALRGIRLARLTVAPVSYNPIAGTIRVYNDIDVEIQYTGADVGSMSWTKASTYSPFFDVIYDQLLSSFPANDELKSFGDLPRNPISMVIIAPRQFEDVLQPFIRWQTEKGFKVIMGYTDVIGASPTTIANFIANQYFSATPDNPAPSFLVIAGDASIIPPSSIGHVTGEVTDLYYASVAGDYFPEMFYGRLSARNEQELKSQIDKIIYYQKYQFEDPSYLNDVTLIAGSDNFWNQLVLQPTVKYGAEHYFHEENGFNNVHLFLSSYEGVYDRERTSVSLINYTAHCSPTTWSNPRLTTTDIHQMSNQGKYPLVIGNCCESALFSLPESIGEAWVRAENKGAVAYIGSAPDTHWFEDFYWSVGAFPIVGNNAGYVPSVSETTIGAFDAPFTFDYLPVGAIQFVGNLAVTQAHIRSYQSQSNTLWYWEGYHTLGDPSTMIFLTEARINDVEHLPVFPKESQTFSVHALPGSYVGLSSNGQLIGAGFVDESGQIDIPVKQVAADASLKVVVTKPQHKTYIREIPVMVSNGPYVVYDSFIINDSQGNNNQRADYGETISLYVALKNIGSEPVQEVYAFLSTDDPYITIKDSDTPSVFSGMQSSGEDKYSSLHDAFHLQISTDVPNEHRARFNLLVSDGQDEWASEFTMVVFAPILKIDPDYIVNDALWGNNNNRLDPGEMISLGFRVYNVGGAQAQKPVVSLQASSPYFTHNQSSISLDNISPGNMRVASFVSQANPATQDGVNVPLEVTATDGHTTHLKTNISIGQPPDITIGNKWIGSNQFPFYNLYRANRTQMIFLGNELGPGEKTINQIGFNITEVAARETVFHNFTIRIKHTDFSQFSRSFQSTNDASTVFYSSTYQMPTTPGWHYWNINDFQYDGKRNILIEISWGQNPGWTTPFYRVASTELDRNRTAYGFTDHHVVAPFSGVSPIRPNLSLSFDVPEPKPSYPVNFLVKNGHGQPIEMAMVKIGTKVQQTNAAGITSFLLFPGTYSYDVFLNNGMNNTPNWKEFNVESSSRSFTANFYDVSFNLKNAKSNESVTDAVISINDNTFEPGNYLLRNLSPGLYQFAVSKHGFIEAAGIFNLVNQNLELSLMLVPDTTVSAKDQLVNRNNQTFLYPNPAREQVTLVLPKQNKSTHIQLINQQGQIVKNHLLGNDHPGQSTTINTTGLPAGIYFVRIRQGDMVLTDKLVIY